MMHSLSHQNLDRECVTGYTSITACNPRISGICESIADQPPTIGRGTSVLCAFPVKVALHNFRIGVSHPASQARRHRRVADSKREVAYLGGNESKLYVPSQYVMSVTGSITTSTRAL